MSGSHEGLIQELREDHPWLAYHRDTEGQISWYVVEIGKQRIAEGNGRDVRFHAEPGKHYYLTAVLPNHPKQESCPLCHHHAFE